MITRVVKMEFNDDQVDLFLKIFNQHSINMKSVGGCISLKLVRDIKTTNLFFTISEWQSEAQLHAYRSSELFTIVWSKVKPLFCANPQAWTTQSVYDGKN